MPHIKKQIYRKNWHKHKMNTNINFQWKKNNNKIKDKTKEEIYKTLESEQKQITPKSITRIEHTTQTAILNNIQRRNNSERLRDIWLEIRAQDSQEINKMIISEKLIKILETLIELWVTINVKDVKLLNNTQIIEEKAIKENIQKLKNKWYNISHCPTNIIVNIIITDADIDKLSKLKNIWYNINNIDIKKLNELTDADIDKLSKLKNIWYNINNIDIKKLNELTDADIDKLSKLINLWYNTDIETIKKITKKNIEYLSKFLCQSFLDLNTLNELTDKDLEEIIKIKNLWAKIYLNEKTIKRIRDWYIENLKKLKDIWINIEESLSWIFKITNKDIENIKKLTSLWIKFDIKYIKHMKWITNTNIKNIKKLIELEINVNISQIKYLKLMAENDINNIKKLKDIWIKFEWYDIMYIKWLKLTDTILENIKKLKETWIEIKPIDLIDIKWINKKDIENIKELQRIWFHIDSDEIKNVKSLTQEEIKKIKDLYWLWIIMSTNSIPNIKRLELNEIDLENIKMLKEIWVTINSYDIPYIKKMKITKNNFDISFKLMAYKTLINRYNSFIKKNEWIPTFDIYDAMAIKNNKEILDIDPKNFYEWYNYTQKEINVHQKYIKWKIIETIQEYIQEKSANDEEIWEFGIVNKIRPNLMILSTDDKISIIWKVYKIVDKYNTIRKYTDFKNWPYKSPKDLLCSMRWIRDPRLIKEITNDISVRKHWVWLEFFIADKRSYRIIEERSLTNTESKSWGFSTPNAWIEELKWTLCVVNGRDPGPNKNSYQYTTIWHEWQHNRNSYFMPDNHRDEISRAKDEITAYQRDWSDIKRIKDLLTESEKEWWIYTYNLTWIERYLHKLKVKRLIKYVKDIIEINNYKNKSPKKDEIISALSSIPVNWWKEFHNDIMKIIKAYKKQDNSILQKTKLKEKFIYLIQENSDNNWLIINLKNLFNTIFPKDSIKLDKFRRTWSEKLETVLNRIEECTSLNEIKYVLKNPKYCHIWRWPNNKWWVEISAIIDEVISWSLEEEFIPIEIRSKVIQYIK